MERKGLALLLAMMLLTGFVLPLPECYVTRVNCPRKASGSCHVFAEQRDPGKSPCSFGFRFSRSRGEQEKPKKCCELLRKLKSYPVRSLLTVIPDPTLMFVVASDASTTPTPVLKNCSSIIPVKYRQRAGPIFLQNQSFLI